MIRLWKVGDKSNPPNQHQLSQIEKIIRNAIKSGETDIVFGPELSVELVNIEQEENWIKVDENTYRKIK